MCILSWIWIGVSLLSVTSNFTTGQMTPEMIEEQKSQMLGMYSEEEIERMDWMFEDMFHFIDSFNENLYVISGITMISTLLGLLGVIMMWQMKKKGYYLYLVYSIVPMILAVLFYQGVFMGFFLGYHIVFGGLFMLLYAFQLKHME